MLMKPHSAAGVDYANLIFAYDGYRAALAKTINHYRFTACYGCGNEFLSTSQEWKNVSERPLDFCCDRDSAKWGKEINGITCISPEELFAKGEDCAVFITTGDVAGASLSLLASGVPNLFLFNKFALHDEKLLANFSKEDICLQISDLYNLLEDNLSARVLDALIMRLFAGVAKYNLMLNIYSKDQYFPIDIVSLHEHEVLIDAGAFNGDSICAFQKKTGGNFDHIYAFELDTKNFAALNNTIAKFPKQKKISLYNLGLWDTNGEIHFCSAGPATAVDNNSTEAGQVVRLDDFLPDKKVTMIKMDIEGAEQNALRGAKKNDRRPTASSRNKRLSSRSRYLGNSILLENSAWEL